MNKFRWYDQKLAQAITENARVIMADVLLSLNDARLYGGWTRKELISCSVNRAKLRVDNSTK